MEDKSVEFGLELPGIKGNIKTHNKESRLLQSFGAIVVDKLYNYRWNNAIKFLDKYDELKQKRQLEGKEIPLPPKYLLDVLEYASKEDDGLLHSLWARLLINWQDPEKRCDMNNVYISIMGNLSPMDAKILEIISKDLIMVNNSTSFSFGFETEDYDFSEVGYFIGKQRVINEIGITDDQYALSINNLFRCMCLESVMTPFLRITISNQNPVLKNHGIEFVKPTIIGRNLIKNCFFD